MFGVKRMALSKSELNKEVSNLACIVRILLGPCTDILRDVLTNEISLSDLKEKYEYFTDRSNIMRQSFSGLGCLIYIFDGNYSDFDIPLLYFFLRILCDIPSHNTEWGHIPNEKDRSLSANIERIYVMHKKYRYYPDDSLKDSIFEEDWERIFQIVKELEEHIGSGTANQDAIKKMKNSSLDSDVEHFFITKLGTVEEKHMFGMGPLMNPWMFHDHTIPLLKEDVQVYARREIESYLDLIDKSRLPFGLGQFKEEGTPEKIQQITSEKLKKLFSSFEVMFPEDVPNSTSFARNILQYDIDKLETAIRLLSKRIVLNTKKDTMKAVWPKAEARIIEVDVVYDGVRDQFCVFRKDISSDVLFEMPDDENDRIKVMLISSDSIPVVSAKLLAYKNFKRVINEKEIYLQHEYEDFDDVAKLIAYNIVSSFCLSLDSVINAFTNDLYKILFDNYGTPLDAMEIRQMCCDVLRRTAHKTKPFRSTIAGRWWPLRVSYLIQEQISEENLAGVDAWDEIQNICRKTVEDLKKILSKLEDFKTNELQVDQKKQIKEWFKAEIFPNRSLLLKYPSIIKYLAGYRHGEEVVKVYLSSDDEGAKIFFKKNCNVSKEAHFEFVNVEEINVKGKDEEKTDYKRKVPAAAAAAADESNKEDLMQIIRENGGKILAKYSNVIGIRVGQTKPYRITLCCLDRTIIPFGEQPLPESIAGYPCYVREDFFIFGTCPLNCTNDLPKPGCSIGVLEKRDAGCSTGVPEKQGAGCSTGVPEKQGAECSNGEHAKHGAGSVGFFYESKKGSKYGSGFITAFHVAIENRYLSRYQNHLLSNCVWKKNENKPTHNMVHPKCKNHEGEENIVGKVVEAFFGKYKLSKTLSEGLDFAVVKTKSCRQGEKEILQFFKREEQADREMVTKTGKTTKKTYGYLIKDMMLAEISIPGFIDTVHLPELYIVEDTEENQRFFEKGDSGSGVFVVGKEQQEKVLGIGIAISLEKPETYVCKIDKIVKNMELTLVRYTEDKQKETSPNTENKFNENTQTPTDWLSKF